MGLTIVSTPTNHKHSRDDVDAEGGESSSKKRKVTNPKPQPDMMTVNIRIRIVPDAPLQTVSLEMAISQPSFEMVRPQPWLEIAIPLNPFEKKLLVMFPTLQEYDFVIPSPVKTIPSYAFSYCQSLTTVKLPDTMKSINWRAFYGCKKLHKINSPSSLEFIDGDAFSSCPNLQDFHFPANIITFVNRSIDCGFSGKDKKRLKTIRVDRSTLAKANLYSRVKRFLDTCENARLELIDDQEVTPKCAMCLEDVPLNTMFTKCSHVFCMSCCVKGGYLYDGETKKNCPVCKTEQASSCIKVMIRP